MTSLPEQLELDDLPLASILLTSRFPCCAFFHICHETQTDKLTNTNAKKNATCFNPPALPFPLDKMSTRF